MSIYDPPSDPYYCDHECHECDQPLKRMLGEWVCVTKTCKNSINYRGDDDRYEWCPVCEAWIEKSKYVRWTGDDQLHYLCPGCDSDMVEPQLME